jgi:ribosomal protein S18 acetylase RimI-like enzyme
MVIRPITKEDTAELVKLMHVADGRDESWALNKIDKFLSNENWELFVAEDKELLGFLGVKDKYDKDEAKDILGDAIDNYSYLAWMAVHPDYRKQGIARQLASKCEDWSKERKKSGIWLECKEHLILFYGKLGYTKKGSYGYRNVLVKVF